LLYQSETRFLSTPDFCMERYKINERWLLDKLIPTSLQNMKVSTLYSLLTIAQD